MQKLSEIDIGHKIYFIRGHRVMLDSDLAQLYGVETKVLNQAVRRNLERFPADFMFQLMKNEWEFLKSQIVTSKSGSGGKQKLPLVFTEFGVAMLSSVLRSNQAIQVNIMIMRTFGRLRQILESHKDLVKRINDLEAKYDDQFKVVFEAIRRIVTPPLSPNRRKIGI